MNSLIEQAQIHYLITFVIALAVSYALTPVCRFLALKYNILDKPHSDIKTHKAPTPYLGGIAIWSGYVASLFFIRFLTHFPTGTLRSLRGILIGSSIILLLGLIDDIIPKGLGYGKKFIFQAVAAVVLVWFSISISFISPSYMAAAFSIIWVIGITNAFNIIDIMDGLSGGIALIASLAFLFIALPSEQIYVNFSAVALAGGCLGFLPYNLSSKKKIFMGDTGSLTIGFTLAAVSMGGSYSNLSHIGLFAPLLILAIPIYDTILVMVLRWSKGQSPFIGSKDHFALRLEKLGIPRKQILLITYLASIILAANAFLMTRLPPFWATGLFLLIIIILLYVGRKLSKVKMY